MNSAAALAAALPDLLNSLAAGPRQALFYSFFKIGGVSITLLFLVKAGVFLGLLFGFAQLLQKFLLGRFFAHFHHLSDAMKFAISRFLTYGFFSVGLFVGLQSLGVDLSSLVVFGGAVGVGVGLGLQNVVSNFVAGLILLIEQPIRIADRIETGGTFGDVVKIGARSTWVRTNENVVIIVPNNTFIEKAVTNWTVNDANVRVSVLVGVGYRSDPEAVRDMMLGAARTNSNVLKEPPPSVIFTGYGDNSINFELWVWTSTRSHQPVVLKSELYFALFKIFNEHGIELPFPQRDLHLRSSDVALPFAGLPPNVATAPNPIEENLRRR